MQGPWILGDNLHTRQAFISGLSENLQMSLVS